VAGKPRVRRGLLGRLTPDIWRKHLDFAASHDIL